MCVLGKIKEIYFESFPKEQIHVQRDHKDLMLQLCVSSEDGTDSGSSNFSLLKKDVLVIRYIYLPECFQKQGFGKKLFSYLIEHGDIDIKVEVVQNKKFERLLSKLGFEKEIDEFLGDLMPNMIYKCAQ